MAFKVLDDMLALAVLARNIQQIGVKIKKQRLEAEKRKLTKRNAE